MTPFFQRRGPMTNEGNSRGLLVIEAWSLVISCRLGDFAVLLTAFGPNDEFSKSKGQKVPRKPAKGLLVLARHSWWPRLRSYRIRSPNSRGYRCLGYAATSGNRHRQRRCRNQRRVGQAPPTKRVHIRWGQDRKWSDLCVWRRIVVYRDIFDVL